MQEEYVDIFGYENYQISNFGNIRNKKSNKIIKSRMKKSGYFDIALSSKNKRKKFLIHRLVAMHFIDNPENKPQVNHIDGNRGNNIYTNLEWSTSKENTNHSIEFLRFYKCPCCGFNSKEINDFK